VVHVIDAVLLRLRESAILMLGHLPRSGRKIETG
jgi:hypothetical protein